MEPLRVSSAPHAETRELRPIEIAVLREAVRSTTERTKKESSRLMLGVVIGVLVSSACWVLAVAGLTLWVSLL